MGPRDLILELVARAKLDPHLMEQLEANPKDVICRETGIPAEVLERPLDDAELAQVTGAGRGTFNFDDPVYSFNCHKCGFKTDFIDIWTAHQLTDCWFKF